MGLERKAQRASERKRDGQRVFECQTKRETDNEIEQREENVLILPQPGALPPSALGQLLQTLHYAGGTSSLWCTGTRVRLLMRWSNSVSLKAYKKHTQESAS